MVCAARSFLDGDGSAFQGADLKKASVRGGSPITICASAPGNQARRGAMTTRSSSPCGRRRLPARAGRRRRGIGRDEARPCEGEQASSSRSSFRAAKPSSIQFCCGNRLDDAVIVARFRTGTQQVLARGGMRAGRAGASRAAPRHASPRFDPGRPPQRVALWIISGWYQADRRRRLRRFSRRNARHVQSPRRQA